MIEVKDTGIKSYHPDMDGDPLYVTRETATTVMKARRIFWTISQRTSRKTGASRSW